MDEGGLDYQELFVGKLLSHSAEIVRRGNH